MKEKINFAELHCIWKTQPCEAGDTLSGGENVAQLRRLRLIEGTDKGYVTTERGNRVIEVVLANIDRMGVYIETNIKLGEQ